MPLYEYQCDACGGRFEIIQKFSDAPAATCSLCGVEGQVRKLISSPAFQFKGSGWYITDYARKGQGGGDSSQEKSTGKGGADKTGGDAAEKSAAGADKSQAERADKSDAADKKSASAASPPAKDSAS